MKLRHFILTGIAMLLIIHTSIAEVSLIFNGNDLLAHSDSKGVAGFKGCESTNLTEIPAYTFRLLRREMPDDKSSCKIPYGKWKQVDEKISNNGSVLFEDLADGVYKVQCLVGKAIGCRIENAPDGFPERSIVCAQEYSSKITKGVGAEREAQGGSFENNKNGMLLFPNPAQAEINAVITSLQGDVQLAIYDMTGKVMLTKRFSVHAENTSQKINIASYPLGTYLVRVMDARGESLEGKFVVVRN